MSKVPSSIEAQASVGRLKKSVTRNECLSCDCLQGFLTQIELDFPELAEAIEPMKVPAGDMHGCLGCDPCPPGDLFAQYLRGQNESADYVGGECDQRKEVVRSVVREAYGRIARQGGSCCGPSSSCRGVPSSDTVAASIGYNEDELAPLPEGANLGLSCGHPTAMASLRPGEVVLDLGSGGGLDVFIAARRVGPSGRVVGVDMTPEMVAKARQNEKSFRKSTGLSNVEFRLGEIEHLPVADASVDAVISNCVLNLSPDKARVWREIARVLKPGGRVSVSDLALLRTLPDAVRESAQALVGCIAGAALVDDTRRMVREAGLVEAVFEARSDYIDKMSEWSDPLYREVASRLPPGTKPSDFVASLDITARKPARKNGD
ncbi:MAG: arsenite methyltransferase [Planctomycetota bacterium]